MLNYTNIALILQLKREGVNMDDIKNPKKYITGNSGEAKIERALHNLQYTEILIGGLPRKFRKTEKSANEIKLILNEITQLENKLKRLTPQE